MGTLMPDFPQMLMPVDHIEPVPRRLRAMLAGEVVLDTTKALYVWEWPNYPQYYVPIADVNRALLIDEHRTERLARGSAHLQGLRVGQVIRPSSARLYVDGPVAGAVRFDWDALDAWFEEDEEVFVHPRNPYVRVDGLRSTRHVRVERDGALLAESSATVMLFETGLPTRYYFNRTEVDFSHLVPTETVTACPYKGRTSGYWAVRVADATYPDLAWTYEFPAGPVLPIAGMIAFYNEKVDITVDGELLRPPTTHFFR
jgi:uncharacterized protein (DUF427 family)